MKKKLLIFILTLALWFAFPGRFNIQVFVLGTIICSVISLVLADNVFRLVQMKYGTREIFLKMYYIFLAVSAVIYGVFLSAARVSRHAFEIKPSYSPRIITIKTSLENINGIAIAASFITLTQGALAVDFDILNRNYFIHCIDVNRDHEVEVKRALVSKHENLIGKIFD